MSADQVEELESTTKALGKSETGRQAEEFGTDGHKTDAPSSYGRSKEVKGDVATPTEEENVVDVESSDEEVIISVDENRRIDGKPMFVAKKASEYADDDIISRSENDPISGEPICTSRKASEMKKSKKGSASGGIKDSSMTAELHFGNSLPIVNTSWRAFGKEEFPTITFEYFEKRHKYKRLNEDEFLTSWTKSNLDELGQKHLYFMGGNFDSPDITDFFNDHGSKVTSIGFGGFHSSNNLSFEGFGKILSKKLPNLSHLFLGVLPNGWRKNNSTSFPSLPKLKSIEIAEYEDFSDFRNVIFQLLIASSELEEFGNFQLSLLPSFIASHKVDKIKEFELVQPSYVTPWIMCVGPYLNSISLFIQAMPKLKKLLILPDEDCYCDNERVMSTFSGIILPQLLNSSQDTLRELTLYPIALSSLPHSVPQLPNVHTLKLYEFDVCKTGIAKQNILSRGTTKLANFLPNLNCVELYHRHCEDQYGLYEHTAASQVNDIVFPPTVKHLTVVGQGDRGSVKNLSMTFPNVVTLGVKNEARTLSKIITSVCVGTWNNLESLEIGAGEISGITPPPKTSNRLYVIGAVDVKCPDGQIKKYIFDQEKDKRERKKRERMTPPKEEKITLAPIETAKLLKQKPLCLLKNLKSLVVALYDPEYIDDPGFQQESLTNFVIAQGAM